MQNDGARLVRQPHCSERGIGGRQRERGVARCQGLAVPVVAPIVAETSATVKSDWNRFIGRVVQREGRHARVEGGSVC